MHHKSILIGLFLGFVLIVFEGCKHSPLDPMIIEEPPDTTIVDPPDTTTHTPCDSNLVYFEAEILPILRSNCALSGCHDMVTAEDDVILTDYENVIATADVEPFNLSGSKIYEVLTEQDEDDRMPPPPQNRLDAEQIELIARWILQGAEDLFCSENSPCDTSMVSYSGDIIPIVNTYCKGCHSGSAPSGNIDLSNYQGVKTQAISGKLVGVVTWSPGFVKMPQGGSQLPQCDQDKIMYWVSQGALNN